jgi:hypothetical protein
MNFLVFAGFLPREKLTGVVVFNSKCKAFHLQTPFCIPFTQILPPQFPLSAGNSFSLGGGRKIVEMFSLGGIWFDFFKLLDIIIL